jgi:hypothetical protein
MIGDVKGIILNLLQSVVETEHGEQLWDDVLVETGVDGAFTSLGNYPDADVIALVDALAGRMGQTRELALQWFGRRAMPLLAARYPAFFAPDSAVDFVLSLDQIIHAEVVKLYPDAAPPALRFRDVADDRVTVEYRSARGLPDLAVGFLRGTADAYHRTLVVERTDLDDAGTHVLLDCRFDDA